MTNNIQKYTTYKPSGVEWLGDIPEHWEVKRLKYVVELGLTKVLSKDSSFKYIGMENIESCTGRYILTESETEGLSNYFKAGDVLFGKLRPYLSKVFLAQEEGICSTELLVYRVRQTILNSYLYFLMLSSDFIKLIDSSTYGSKMPRASSDFIGNQTLPIPPLSEQTRIAEFLDTKTALIDKAIGIKEKQIELLKERRQIMIHRAVTRGIDPNVKLKPSGVEWIGNIPEHWEVQPIKYSLNGIIDCEHSTAPFVSESDYFVVRTSNVKNGELTSNDAKYTHEKGYMQWTRRGIPKVGDVLLTREAPAGEACLVPGNQKICLGQRMVWLKVDRTKLIPQFLIYIIYSKIGRTYIDYLSAGSTVLHLNMSDIKNIPIMSIPIKEQNEIVFLIEKNSSKIATAISLKEQEIEKLKEYKSVLINSAVTGKIKVG